MISPLAGLPLFSLDCNGSSSEDPELPVESLLLLRCVSSVESRSAKGSRARSDAKKGLSIGLMMFLAIAAPSIEGFSKGKVSRSLPALEKRFLPPEGLMIPLPLGSSGILCVALIIAAAGVVVV